MIRIVESSIFLLLVFGVAFGQQPKSEADPQEIKNLVPQLSWDNVGLECHLFLVVKPAGEVADKLIKIGKPATEELINALEDESKGVAAHLVLTAIWEPKKAAYQIRYIYENDDPKNNPKPLGWTYTYTGLKWAWDGEKGNVVEKSDLSEIARRWRQKVNQH
jgi:hypothetical protein